MGFPQEKDWEDIKKMPEHPTLSKDFKRSKLVFRFLSYNTFFKHKKLIFIVRFISAIRAIRWLSIWKSIK